MDPSLQQALLAYFNSDPAFGAEWNRVRSQGDNRSQAEWLYDHISSHPEDLTKFQSFNQQASSGGANGARASYDQAVQYFINNVPGGSTNPHSDDWNNRFNAWMGPILAQNGVGSIEELPLSAITGTSGGSTPAGPTVESVPLEQGLLETVLPRLLDDIQGDDARATMAAAMRAQAQGDYDLARRLIEKATSGQQLQSELSYADQMGADKRTALQTAINQLYEAQDPLSKARVGEAEDAITGVNLGLERTMDQLDAQRAQQGFVGGSTSDINAATRATIAARQNAAQLMGAAKTANATDMRDIGGFGANEGYGLAKSLADQKSGLFNADYGRSLQAALSLPNLTNTFVQTNSNIDSMRNAGLNRTLGVLDWWSNNTKAPTATYADPIVDTSGNSTATLGSGLINAGFNIANANNWWQPKTPNPYQYGDPNAYPKATGTGPWY